jgi:coatomer subunit delta
VVPDVAGTGHLTEEKIAEKCFSIIFAFDEVITAGGYREPINLQQIRTNLEMESHEEKLHNMIKVSKMESAKDQAKDAAKVIRERQREAQKLGLSMQGIGSDSGSGNPYDTSGSSSNFGALSSSAQSSYGELDHFLALIFSDCFPLQTRLQLQLLSQPPQEKFRQLLLQ